MPSLLPGFEYDIFISYRQNDNRSGWVTEFVHALKEELASTIKDPVNIYFDQNPYDGLLDSHDVDESLKEKLRCLIFIPVMSQTYCDPKGFAWRHEFLAFHKLATADAVGLKIKLTNGNVASRILPIRIHDLDEGDLAMIENEIGPLRGIEFIHRTPGVNRPLNAKDDEVRTARQTLYKDQINKTANAVKEIISGLSLQSTDTAGRKTAKSPPTKSRRNYKGLVAVAASLLLLLVIYFGYRKLNNSGQGISQLDKSIAVLPFANLSGDPGQDYFSDGLTDDIIDKLAKIRGLRVISRTSVMAYKGTAKKIPEIARELGVSFILEGTVRREGEQLKVTTQLIRGESDFHIWSETIDRKLDEVFQIQAEIARLIARYLEITLNERENTYFEQAPTSSIAAYDYYLQARELVYTGRPENDLKRADFLLNNAIKLDPSFIDAFAQLSIVHTFRFTEKGHLDSAKRYAYQSVAMASNRVMPNLAMGYVMWTEDIGKALSYFRKVNSQDPSQGNRQLGALHSIWFSRADSGIYYFDRHLRYFPHESLALSRKGLVYLELKLPDSAKKCFDEARLYSTREIDLVEGYSMYFIYNRKYDSLLAWTQDPMNSELDRSALKLYGAFGYAFKNEYAKSIEWNLQTNKPDTLLLAYCKMRLGENRAGEALLDKYIHDRRNSNLVNALRPADDVELAMAYFLKKQDEMAYTILKGINLRTEMSYLSLILYPFMVELLSDERFKKVVLDDYERWRVEMIANINKMYGR